MDAMEFIRRFLQHVLPTGLMKVRYYGFMSPSASVSLDHIRGLIELANGFDTQTPESEIRQTVVLYCSSCGGELQYRSSIPPFQIPPSRKTVQAVFYKTVPKSA